MNFQFASFTLQIPYLKFPSSNLQPDKWYFL